MGHQHSFSSSLAASSHSTTSWKEAAQEDHCQRGNRSFGEISKFVKITLNIVVHATFFLKTNSLYGDVFHFVSVLPQPWGSSPQPYLLATGTSKAQVSSFYIVLDKKLLPCQSSTSLGAFDELFKSHFNFGVKYDDALSSLFTFCRLPCTTLT